MITKRMRRGTAVLATALSGALLLASCSPSSDTPAEEPDTPDVVEVATLDDLYQQALDSGETTVTVYGPGEAQWEGVYQVFSEQFPEIEVKVEFLFGGDLEARLQQEVATGQHVGDLIHLDDAVRYREILAPFDVVGVEVPDNLRIFDGRLYTPSLSPYGMAYNENALSADEAPTSWADVTDPGFTAKIGMSNPTSLAATSTILYSAYKGGAVDESWFEDLAAKSPTLYQSTSQMMGALGSGEIAFTPVTYYGFVLTQLSQGADVGFVVPEDGVMFTQGHYGLVDGAPNPTAAALLVSWLMSEEGQTAIARDASEFGTMPGAPQPEGLPALSDITLFDTPSPDDWIAFKSEASEFMKQFFPA